MFNGMALLFECYNVYGQLDLVVSKSMIWILTYIATVQWIESGQPNDLLQCWCSSF